MAAQKLHMKLKKGSGTRPGVSRHEKKQKTQASLFQQTKDEGEATIGLLSDGYPQDIPSEQDQTKPPSQSKTNRRGIRKVFGFRRASALAKSKNKVKKQAGYTLTTTPKTSKGSAFHSEPQRESSSSPKAQMPRLDNKATMESASNQESAAFIAHWNPEFNDDLIASENKGPDSPVLHQASGEVGLDEIAPQSIELTYHIDTTPTDSKAAFSPVHDYSSVSGKSSKCMKSSPETDLDQIITNSSNSYRDPEVQSTTALSTALALVGQQGDFRVEDFDPDDFSSEKGDEKDDDTDKVAPGLVSQGSNSSFEFNLDATIASSKSPSPKKPSSTPTSMSSPESKRNKSKSKNSRMSNGFQILMKKSSWSKNGSPKATETQTTIASSTSKLSTISSTNLKSTISPSAISFGSKSVNSYQSQEVPEHASPSKSIRSQQRSVFSSVFSSPSMEHTPKSASSAAAGAANRSGEYVTNVSSASNSLGILRTDGLPTTQSYISEKKSRKLLLSRAFGRHSLDHSSQPWLVRVSPAEWDNTEQRWKYRVQVQRRQTQQESPSSVPFAWRSFENFVWLERALNSEYQGGLVLPLLSIAVGITDLESVTHEIDANLLRDWLSDVLNGVRGQGELLLDYKPVDLLRSEAVEAFLYRKIAPLQQPSSLIMSVMGDFLRDLDIPSKKRQNQRRLFHYKNEYATNEEKNCNNTLCSPNGNHSRMADSPLSQISPSASSSPPELLDNEPDSFVDALWSQGPLALMTSELCASGGCNPVEDSPSCGSSSNSSPMQGKKYDRLGMLDIRDSFIDVSTVTSLQSSVPANQRSPFLSTLTKQEPRMWSAAQHANIIASARDLAISYRQTALLVVERTDLLLEEEMSIGTAWKNFSIALSNLFSYEKEVESARLGDKKNHRDHMPYRKVKKTTIEECLRALMQQKLDRSVSSLRALRDMLTAYVADLSAVNPSVDAYLEGMSQMVSFEEKFEATALDEHKRRKGGESSLNEDKTPTSSKVEEPESTTIESYLGKRWHEQLRPFRPRSENGKNDTDIRRSSSSFSWAGASVVQQNFRGTAAERKKVLRDRVLANESLLKETLLMLCRSNSIRTVRMAWAYFNSEATQCSLLHSSARALQNKIDLSNKERVSQILSRHLDENKADTKTELDLVQRMVNLGNIKKYPLAGSTSNEVFETIEVDSDNQDDERIKGLLRDDALQIARNRVGRWNSKLAMAIMKAVGVDDPNVRVEETTRELRLVRKYAIGLRENLNRCIEAVETLWNAILKGQQETQKDLTHSADGKEEGGNSISYTRKGFFSEFAKLLSGTYVPHNNFSSPKELPKSSVQNLNQEGIDLSDPMGWDALCNRLQQNATKNNEEGECGSAALCYLEKKDSRTGRLLSTLTSLLNEYTERVEDVESFVYMECVGVQLEKHFSQKRANALSAFEKKTDITTAINIATRKRIPGLVDELQAKLEKFGPEATHTSVKETKEAHIESKKVKSELHEVALARLLRARATSTERVIRLLECWAKAEESTCISELDALSIVFEALEKTKLEEEIQV